MWAKFATRKEVTQKDLKNVKVGNYDALFFETIIPSNQKERKDLKWRQWVFMVNNKAYFVVSTLPLDLEDKIYPDVEAMLKSFRVKGKMI